ncbi:heavy-metal-associated domain-containing protein [Pseudogulbenkiania sp. MAI-1]|uniref:heavy-metal-associated domain-containing protein n=1 Tax=Pseudogulbenkiania sp. MAI-1 TaxID=990370 RepID=UPI00045E7B02|nr:cation transporter [Pseudogulbenkiania sp. MAI-1]
MEKIILHVEGMTCNGCANSIKNALGGLEGVRQVEVDLASGKVEVLCDAGMPTRGMLAEAVSDAGYDVVG